MKNQSNKNIALEDGTYEIIRQRLDNQANELRNRLNQLNQARKEVFGAIETQLIANDRINTDNHCIARDIVAIGDLCIFGYNVHIGLRSGIKIKDVFSVYNFKGNSFHEEDLSLLNHEKFELDFHNLYRYYKEAYFARFIVIGSYLYMVFHVSKTSEDFKSFKWLIKDGELIYIDNRSDQEVQFPDQHEFKWTRVHRDFQRKGKHPHVSVMDRLFVETVGGDLTIKVEDNTENGLGIYREEVEYQDQTLDDAEYFYADLGHLIVLKIRPYQEEFRYFVFNEKMKEVKRIDSLEDSGVLLPDQHGLIFANGYYLQTGEYKIFDPNMRNKRFKKRIVSPNGEDFLYIFYNNTKGTYVLHHYNLIAQSVSTPIICNGYALFPNGELTYFKAEDEATKHHVAQIWQTPFVAGDIMPSEHKDSYLFKIGNKDIVKAMAECQEVLILCGKQDSYNDLYADLSKKCADINDSYYWIGKEEAFNMAEGLTQIQETASSAIEEYEKKRSIEKSTAAEIDRVNTKAEKLFDTARRQTFDRIDLFVEALSGLRVLRGEIISLKELRYSNLELVETLESKSAEMTDQLSNDCVQFLLLDEALRPYEAKVEEEAEKIELVKTGMAAKERESSIEKIAGELELLIEIVSNLKIEDATHTTRIIDNISTIFARLNQIKAAIKKKQKNLLGTESVAEFNAQLKLLDQGIINYLDISDSPQKCDEYLTKLMVQLEELEGRFVEFEEFILKITEKREEVYNAFETKKNSLLEIRNNRTLSLQNAADRILKGIRTRIKSIKDINEINGFFAADLMIDKVRDIIQQLNDLDDSNKASTVQTTLKTLKEEAIRQLRDRQDLFVDGENVIQLGKHKFSVNIQPLDLTIVQENGKMNFHLTGTDFFAEINDPEFLKTNTVWGQSIISENALVSRAEYLAYQVFQTTDRKQLIEANGNLLQFVQQHAATRYQEAYTKGIHDEDASKLLKALLDLSGQIDLLCFLPEVRACAKLFWKTFLASEQKALFQNQFNSAGKILKIFPDTHGFDFLIDNLEAAVSNFIEEHGLFAEVDQQQIAEYLFRELTRSEHFILSQPADQLRKDFMKYLKVKSSTAFYKDSLFDLRENPVEQYELIRKWVEAFIEQNPTDHGTTYLEETAALLFLDDFKSSTLIKSDTMIAVNELQGTHPVIEEGHYAMDYNDFMSKMAHYTGEVVPRFQHFIDLKKSIADHYRKDLRLEEFKPRVLSSFVRNQLIDQVYLPIFGDNLAKQIGTVGEGTRTDRMGMLLLISPPGYGKTTLMEYIANRLGLIFMKINGPALGHQVTSLDPGEAPNIAAAQELEKLNLALEMGNNVMLYVDDIQHCHSEFLQKFISLCDAQRKIEGVYKGQSKTYDLRGKRISVVMAGNPYTESGEKFQIPDMLANRADIYNLGNIIGDSEKVFKLSYIENALTSNPVLQKLAVKSHKDVHTLLKYIETNSQEGLTFEANHSPEEINEYTLVLKKLLDIRDVVLMVNQEYIRSAAMSEDYRTEPAFKLQGSYRDMNKLSEKVVPIMNDAELNTLILSHYESEAQTLTAAAEANLLKFKELNNTMDAAEAIRWESIKKTFVKNNIFRTTNSDDPMSQVLVQMAAFTDGVEGIRDVLGMVLNAKDESEK